MNVDFRRLQSIIILILVQKRSDIISHSFHLVKLEACTRSDRLNLFFMQHEIQ